MSILNQTQVVVEVEALRVVVVEPISLLALVNSFFTLGLSLITLVMMIHKYNSVVLARATYSFTKHFLHPNLRILSKLAFAYLQYPLRRLTPVLVHAELASHHRDTNSEFSLLVL